MPSTISHNDLLFVASTVIIAVLIGSGTCMTAFVFYVRASQNQMRQTLAHTRELQNLVLSATEKDKIVDTAAFRRTQDATHEFDDVPDDVLQEAVEREVGIQALREETDYDDTDGLGGVIR